MAAFHAPGLNLLPAPPKRCNNVRRRRMKCAPTDGGPLTRP